MRKLLIYTLLMFPLAILAQDFNVYQRDFNALHKVVSSNHPKAFAEKAYFDSIAKVFIDQLHDCNDDFRFGLSAQEYMTHLADGHSSISISGSTSRNGYFPVHFLSSENKIYLYQYPDDISVDYIGMEIATVNDVPIDDLMDKARKIIPMENEVYYYDNLARYLPYSGFLNVLGANGLLSLELTFKEDPALTFSVRKDTVNEKIIFNVAEDEWIYKPGKYTYHKREKHDYSGWNNNLFHYEMFEEQSTCYFHYQECRDLQYLKTMKGKYKPYWLYKMAWKSRGGDFSMFLNEMFNEVDDKNIESLVVDLRDNNGGTSILGLQLLDYLTNVDSIMNYKDGLMMSALLKEKHPDFFNETMERYLKAHTLDSTSLPFYISSTDISWNKVLPSDVLRDVESGYYQEAPLKKFGGNVYVLIGPEVYSSSAMLATELVDNNLAISVGEPIRMKPSHYGEFLNFELPETKLKGSVSCKKFVRPNPANDPAPNLNPDYKITQTVKEYSEGKDPVFDYVFKELIKTNVPEKE